LKREVRFKIPITDRINLTGAFDVYWEDGDGIHLRDWKTNIKDSVLEFYENQLKFYSLAISRLKGKPLTVGIVSVKDCKLLSVPNDERFDKTEDRIINMSRIASTGPWGQKKENCPACPWKGCI
jgi:hypothetical protein